MRRATPWATTAILFAFAPTAGAQDYKPVESPFACKEGETPADCRERLCKPDETDAECQARILEERQKSQQQGKGDEGDKRDEDDERDEDDDERDEDDERDGDNAREEREERAEEAREEREEREEEAREKREEREEEARDEREEREEREERDDDDSGSGGSDLLRPGTRPMFFVGAVGPSFFGIGRGRGLRGPGYSDARAKLALDFGYHLDGAFEGPAIGATIEQTFSEFFYVFNPGFKFWWDIQPVDDYGIYIAPFAKAGYALATCGRSYLYRYYGFVDRCPHHAFNLGLGVEGRLVLDDRWVLLLRPVQLDTYLGNFFGETFWFNYSLLIGGGVSF